MSIFSHLCHHYLFFSDKRINLVTIATLYASAMITCYKRFFLAILVHHICVFLFTVLLKDKGEIVRIQTLTRWNILCLAFEFKVNNKLGSNSLFALDSHWSAHFFNDLFTNGEAKPGASFIPILIFRQSAEVNEETFHSLLRHANACICHIKLQRDVRFCIGNHLLIKNF